jgi:pimeloyl-ACP methyl ester carboxylesterase
MDRRHLLKSAGGLLAASALAPATARAMEADSCGRVADPATFVFVHGAWHGSFAYDPMAKILRDRGHVVYVPTLSGVGERSNVRPPGIGIPTHVQDILNVIKFSDLNDIVLVGHSYGGMVATGVADRVPEKISSLVYLDAFVPEDGQSTLDTGIDPDIIKVFAAARDRGDKTLPLPEQLIERFNIPRDQLWRFTPQPIACQVDPIHLTGKQKTIAKKTFIRATGNDPGFKKYYDMAKADPSWRTATIDTGHGMMVENPERTAELLEDAI